MSTNLRATKGERKPLPLLAWIDLSASVLVGVGLGCWLWLLQHRNLLPSPEVKAGKALLKQYQATSHDIFLALLALSAITLLVLIRCAPYWIAGPAKWFTKIQTARRTVAFTGFIHHDDLVRRAMQISQTDDVDSLQQRRHLLT